MKRKLKITILSFVSLFFISFALFFSADARYVIGTTVDDPLFTDDYFCGLWDVTGSDISWNKGDTLDKYVNGVKTISCYWSGDTLKFSANLSGKTLSSKVSGTTTVIIETLATVQSSSSKYETVTNNTGLSTGWSFGLLSLDNNTIYYGSAANVNMSVNNPGPLFLIYVPICRTVHENNSPYCTKTYGRLAFSVYPKSMYKQMKGGQTYLVSSTLGGERMDKCACECITLHNLDVAKGKNKALTNVTAYFESHTDLFLISYYRSKATATITNFVCDKAVGSSTNGSLGVSPTGVSSYLDYAGYSYNVYGSLTNINFGPTINNIVKGIQAGSFFTALLNPTGLIVSASAYAATTAILKNSNNNIGEADFKNAVKNAANGSKFIIYMQNNKNDVTDEIHTMYFEKQNGKIVAYNDEYWLNRTTTYNDLDAFIGNGKFLYGWVIK